jgi:hypothetical protein
MQYKWMNDGEPDDNGDFVAEIYNTAGARVSTFKGKTHKEVADELLKSQVNANVAISRLQRPDRAKQPAPLKVEDKQIPPADRMRLASEITDPTRIVEAVTEIVTAQQGGVSPRESTNRLADMTVTQQDQYYKDEATAFVQQTPDYYPVQQNRDKLFAALEANQLDLTRNNLTLVYQTLLDQGELIPWPEEPTDVNPNGSSAAPNGKAEPNPPSPTHTRPRSVSTGLRPSQANATPPPPPAPKRWTRADIERMPRAEYNERIQNDPAFKRAVDNL